LNLVFEPTTGDPTDLVGAEVWEFVSPLKFVARFNPTWPRWIDSKQRLPRWPRTMWPGTWTDPSFCWILCGPRNGRILWSIALLCVQRVRFHETYWLGVLHQPASFLASGIRRKGARAGKQRGGGCA
jgi:hypothetical protein